MKIRTAIFGVYVAASAVGFALLMAFILSEVRPRYVDSMRRTLNDTATLLAVLVEDELGAEASLGADWRERLAAVDPASGGLRVYVTDVRGRVTFDSAGGREVGRDYSQRPEMQAFFERPSDVGDAEAGVVEGEIRVAAPVRRAGAVLGYVGVARPLSSVADAIWQARVRLLAGALVLALAMIVAGWWIASRVTRSVERLTAYVQALGAGQPAVRPASGATEVAALARAFDEMRAALEGKQYVERYTQTLTHELKAPLSAIRGAAELLGEDLPPEERTKFLGHLRAESDRLQRIVDRMLQLSALEARSGLQQTERLDLMEALRAAADSLEPVWRTRRIHLHIEKADRCEIAAERFLVGQALTNLLQNAAEFSPAGGTVRARVVHEAGRCCVQVDDEGPGVPEFAVGRIFDRFYSLPRPDTGRKSSGLGLSFVREIAQLHGGGANVANRAEGGARAEIWFPAV